MIKGFFVNLSRNGWMREDGFDFGSKDQPTVVLIEIERLDPHPIAREHEPVALAVPNSDRKVALELVNEINSEYFVEMK